MKTLKATMTSKGQVTIPKAVRMHMNIKNGDVLLFDLSKGEGSNGVFIEKVEEKECAVCQGTGHMMKSHPCVVCDGSGVEKRGSVSTLRFLNQIVNKYKHSLGLSYEIKNADENSLSMAIRLTSKQLDTELVNKLEKYFQTRMDEEVVD